MHDAKNIVCPSGGWARTLKLLLDFREKKFYPEGKALSAHNNNGSVTAVIVGYLRLCIEEPDMTSIFDIMM
ncbi:MAG: hypothetical protein H0T53_10715 [Herpetosiphonaceae bacterium]|nr:hypothetical protein [Herpetosiphonaceae bacterium]